MDASTWANVIAGLALLVAVVTLVLSRRDVAAARRSAVEADARADRAAAVAEQAARSGEAAAAAQHEIARRLPKPPPEWQLTRLDSMRFELRNVGDGPAIDVDLDETYDLLEVEGGVRPNPWNPDDFVVMSLYPGNWDRQHPAVVVTWAGGQGERLRWEGWPR